VAVACPKKTIAWAEALDGAPHCETAADLEAASVEFAFAVSPEDELFPGETIDRNIQNGFVRTAYAGTGMMLVAREVFDALKRELPDCRYHEEASEAVSPEAREHLFAFFDAVIHPRSRRYLSEDYAFCHRWRSCGGKVWLDVQSAVAHEGTFLFEGDPRRRLELERRRTDAAKRR